MCRSVISSVLTLYNRHVCKILLFPLARVLHTRAHIHTYNLLERLMLQAFVNANRYDDKHLMSNEVMDKTQSPLKAMYNVQSPSRNTDCPTSSKPAMANRLLDWFSVVMADFKHRRQHPKPKGIRQSIVSCISIHKCLYF